MQVLGVLVISFVGLTKYADACNGYSLVLESLKTCDPKSVVYSKDFNITLDKNCQLLPKGCLVVSKPLKTAVGQYTVKKGKMPDIVAKVDVCKEGASKNKIWQLLANSGIKCPMAAKSVCVPANTKIDISKYRNQLSVAAGKAELSFDIDHDSGKTCVQAVIDIKK